MNLAVKVLLGLLLLAGSFYAGYWYKDPATVIRWKTKTEIKEIEKVITVRVTETTHKPDGTSTEKVTEKITANTETKSKDNQNKQIEIAPPKPLNRFAVGLNFSPRLTTPYLVPNAVSGDLRVVENLWLTGMYNWSHQEILVGLRMEF